MRYKLPYYLVFLLTAADVFLTAWGTTAGIISEANPLLDSIYSHKPFLASIAVLAAVGVTLVFLYRVRQRVRWMSAALTALISVKIFTAMLHVRWILYVALMDIN